MKQVIRTQLTFTYDDTRDLANDIMDRLDQILCDEFEDGSIDVHTRWVCRLEDAPLFGAAVHFDGTEPQTSSDPEPRPDRSRN